MSVEQNKEVARKTWEAAVKGDIDTATANISDEVSWLLPGSINPGGPLKGKQAVAGFFKGLGTAFPGGLKTEIRRVYGDGDTVLMELTNRGQTAKGKQYENEYCFVLEFEGGKIQARARIHRHRQGQRGFFLTSKPNKMRAAPIDSVAARVLWS